MHDEAGVDRHDLLAASSVPASEPAPGRHEGAVRADDGANDVEAAAAVDLSGRLPWRESWADYFGDLVVPRDSARGWEHAEDGAVGSSRTVHLGGLNHLDLQNHPRVHSLIADVVGVVSPDSEDPRSSELSGR